MLLIGTDTGGVVGWGIAMVIVLAFAGYALWQPQNVAAGYREFWIRYLIAFVVLPVALALVFGDQFVTALTSSSHNQTLVFVQKYTSGAGDRRQYVLVSNNGSSYQVNGGGLASDPAFYDKVVFGRRYRCTVKAGTGLGGERSASVENCSPSA